MAKKKKSKAATASSPPKRRSNVSAPPSTQLPTSLFSSSSLPGILLAAGVAFWYRYQSSGEDSLISSSNTQPPPYYIPKPGSWDDGYYSSPIPDQNFPSTHASIYPNGGIGEPTEAYFETDEEFLSAGRLYNELGQIVQSRFHFENGTA